MISNAVETKPQVAADEALRRLLEGNAAFSFGMSRMRGADPSRRAKLVNGQHPFAVILSCADSRVVPELLFDQGLGDLFTIRVAGNVAEVAALASIEYAILKLGVPLTVVLGHQSCGAVTAAAHGGDHGYHLNMLTAHMVPATSNASDTPLEELVKRHARNTARALVERSSVIRNATKNGTHRVVPAYYSLASGAVEIVDSGDSGGSAESDD